MEERDKGYGNKGKKHYYFHFLLFNNCWGNTNSLSRTPLGWPLTALITFSPILIGLRQASRGDCAREASKKLFVHLAVLQSTTSDPRITWEIHGNPLILFKLDLTYIPHPALCWRVNNNTYIIFSVNPVLRITGESSWWELTATNCTYSCFWNMQRSCHVKLTSSAAMAASRQMRALYAFALRDLYYKRTDMSVQV